MQPNTAITAPNESPIKSATTKIIIAIIVLSFAGSGYCFSQSDKTGSKMNTTNNKSTEESNLTINKRFYTLDMECHDVGCEILINDIPVLTIEYPIYLSKFLINQWLVNGSNTFKIRSLAVSAEAKSYVYFSYDNMSCKVVIQAPEEELSDTMLAEAEIKPSEKSPIVSKDGVFTAKLEYPNPAWAQSEKIGRDTITQKKIIDKYREFHRLLKQKDLDGIMKFSAVKIKEYSQSTYNPDFESAYKNSFKEQLAGSGQLIGIDEQEKKGLRYEYYYGDRLVSIKNDEKQPIIMYFDKERGSTTQRDLFFYFDGNDFVLIL